MYSSYKVAERIKETAKSKGIALGVLLQDCELSKNTISTMQNREFFPRLETISKISDHLNCSVDYLIGRTDNPNSHKSDNTLELSSDNISISEKYNQLDPHSKKIVNMIINEEYTRKSADSENDDVEIVYKVARTVSGEKESIGEYVPMSKEKLDLLESAPESDIE